VILLVQQENIVNSAIFRKAAIIMRQQANLEIRSIMKEKKIFQWQVAVEIGISDVTLVRWLRLPLSDEKKEMVMKAINAAAKQNV
jgi:aminopeptidase-like protein